MDIVPPAEDINARSKSIRSGKVLILAMRRTRSLRKSASKGGVSSGEDVSPGRTRGASAEAAVAQDQGPNSLPGQGKPMALKGEAYDAKNVKEAYCMVVIL